MTSLFKCSVVAVTLAAACFQASGRTVNARLVYFSPSGEDPAELFVAAEQDGEFIKCAPTSSVSREPIACPVGASGKVVFTKTEGGGKIVASAVVPAGVSQAVFFFLKNPNSPGKGMPYQVLVVDESNNALPKGGSFICNIAPQSARVTTGEFNYELPPGKSVHVKRPKTDAYNLAPFKVQIQTGDGWAPVKDTELRFAENERYFMIVYPESGTRSSVKIYKQAVLEAKPQVP